MYVGLITIYISSHSVKINQEKGECQGRVNANDFNNTTIQKLDKLDMAT